MEKSDHVIHAVHSNVVFHSEVVDSDLASDERLARCLQEIENESAKVDEITIEEVSDIRNDADIRHDSDILNDTESDNQSNDDSDNDVMDILAIIGDVEDVDQFLASQRQMFRTFNGNHDEDGDDDDDDSDNEENVDERFWMRLLMRTLSQQTAEVDTRIQEECQVCLETVKLNKRPCCEQAVCDDCLRQYVETQLVDVGIVRIGCPNPSCEHGMYQEEVRELLRDNSDLRDRYDHWIVDMNADPHRKTCPRCCKITEIEPEQLKSKRTAKHGLQINCSECELEWCFPCQAPWHDGITCKSFRTGDALLKQWAGQKVRPQEYNAQRCPKCKVYIQRTEGCDHMTCSRCNTEFCYRCGGRRRKLKLFGYLLEDHDMKHSIVGCNEKYKPDHPLQRSVTRGSIFGAKVVGGIVGAPIVIGMAAGALGIAVVVAAVAAPTYGSYKLARLIQKRRQEAKFK